VRVGLMGAILTVAAALYLGAAWAAGLNLRQLLRR
jgi:putative peptidoglycan lipid II flippase